MKKICSILLVLTLVLASCSVAFAAPVEITSVTENNNTSQDVKVNIVGATNAIVYSVDVTWSDLTFTYTKSGSNWDTEEHKSSGNGNAWNKQEAIITLTNHSNDEIKVAASFNGSDTTVNSDGVNLTLSALNADDSAAILGELVLADAKEVATNKPTDTSLANTKKIKVSLTVDDGVNLEDITEGTIISDKITITLTAN